MKRIGGFIIGLGIALLAFDATVAILRLAHHDEVCICVSRIGP